MSGFLFDTNLLLDIATQDPKWIAWSEQQLRFALGSGAVIINPIIYAELAPAFANEAALEQWLDPIVFMRAQLPYAAGWRASEAFMAYRRAGGMKSSPLPDFYIGAHAEVDGLTLVTRDATRYRTYFPRVALVAP